MKKLFSKFFLIVSLASTSIISLKAQSSFRNSAELLNSDDSENKSALQDAKDTARQTPTDDVKNSKEKEDSVNKAKPTYGFASFYAKFFEGALTATGEIFSQKNLTAASNNFKLNTWVRVINLLNGKSIIVRINDRMHPRMAAKGRVVDLSFAAAKTLNFINAGTTKVKVEVVARGTRD